MINLVEKVQTTSGDYVEMTPNQDPDEALATELPMGGDKIDPADYPRLRQEGLDKELQSMRDFRVYEEHSTFQLRIHQQISTTYCLGGKGEEWTGQDAAGMSGVLPVSSREG